MKGGKAGVKKRKKKVKDNLNFPKELNLPMPN